MIKLKVNNINYEVPEGSTILEIARDAGLDIPTLCHKDGLPHYSSCMVCMVRDNRTNNYLPSCSALVEDGMDIDTNSNDVIELRHKAVELLLSEHRAECEAPCKIVCPAGYNIPLMNRLISQNNFKAAIELGINQLTSEEIKCTTCPGYCENACRRKKVDIPVSIRNLQLFVYEQIKQFEKSIHSESNSIQSTVAKSTQQEKAKKRFSSHIGKLEASELSEWLKECSDQTSRSLEITDIDSAVNESGSCMHCDCRAADDCSLRDLAEDFSIKDPRGKLVNSPIVKKINHNTGLIFENAKCIKCGLCVRICEDSTNEPALCFINRGFISIISEPLTEEFDNILKTKSKEVVEICPTGALSFFYK
jgi:predicted molibdopterin-dependent oxidoreductase YjgC